jgi:hypothetical protein
VKKRRGRKPKNPPLDAAGQPQSQSEAGGTGTGRRKAAQQANWSEEDQREHRPNEVLSSPLSLLTKGCLSNLSHNMVIASSESHHLCPIKYGMMLFRNLFLDLMFVPFSYSEDDVTSQLVLQGKCRQVRPCEGRRLGSPTYSYTEGIHKWPVVGGTIHSRPDPSFA